MTKCTYLTFDLTVTFIRTFRRDIHPGAVGYIPKTPPSMNAEYSQKSHQNVFLSIVQYVRLTILCIHSFSAFLQSILLQYLEFINWHEEKRITGITKPFYENIKSNVLFIYLLFFYLYIYIYIFFFCRC